MWNAALTYLTCDGSGRVVIIWIVDYWKLVRKSGSWQENTAVYNLQLTWPSRACACYTHTRPQLSFCRCRRVMKKLFCCLILWEEPGGGGGNILDLSMRNIPENTICKKNLKGSEDDAQHSKPLGLWALSIVRNCKYKKTQRFGNWICFRPQMREGRHSVGSLWKSSSWGYLFLKDPTE
jgi:hypothetical protein